VDQQTRGTAVGVMPDRSHAERAVAELLRHGFTAEQIGVVTPDAPPGVEPPALDPGTKAGEGAALGVAAGATLGGLLGVALTAMLIPGVGPVLAGGLLAGLLGGVAAGAAGGGIVGTLVGLEVPHEEAEHFHREFHSGRTLVIVRAADRRDEALAILNRVAQEGPATAHVHPRAGRLGSADVDNAPGGGSVNTGF
jgi:hypothetical protein